jgi:hypothetical protein
MKILPPVRQWLPALIRTRAGGSVIAASALIAIGVFAFTLIRPVDTSHHGDGGKPGSTDKITVDSQACTELVLDRAGHQLSAGTCATGSLNAGPTIRDDRPLQRTDMPPRSNQLTAADRAITAPEKLRTSVWDVGVTPNQGESTSPEATALGVGTPPSSAPPR